MQNLFQFRIKKVQFDMSHEEGFSVSFDHPARKKARIAR